MIKSVHKSVEKVRAVIFDMDGVITNTMPDHFHAWKTILHEEGISVSHLDVYTREGQRGITSLQDFFAIHKRPFDAHHAKRILNRKEELFKKIARQRFITGSRQFLKFLKRAGFQLALVTGTSRHELHRILPDRIFELFDVVVTGDDVVNGKPDPEPYLKALQKLNLSAEDGVVLENAPYGISSAKAAGLRCIAIATSLPEEYLSQADVIFPSIREMRQHVDFINPAFPLASLLRGQSKIRPKGRMSRQSRDMRG